MLQQIILLGVDDATLTGVAPRLVLGSVENLKQPDAMIIDRAGFQFMWPGEEPRLGKVVELNDHRAVIVGISDASAPFTTYPVVYTKYSSARNYVGRTRKQMPFVLVHARPDVDTHQLAQRITAETRLKALTWRQEREPRRAALYKATVALVRAYANIADELEVAGYTSVDIARIRLRGLFQRVIGTAIAKGTAVPIIKKQESGKRGESATGAESSILVGVDQGSQSLHIEEVSVAPNARISPAH
jgi:hypothetical protein